MIVASNKMTPGTLATLNGKNAGDDAELVGSFSAALDRLFSSSSSDATGSVPDVATGAQQKHSKSHDNQDSSQEAAAQPADVAPAALLLASLPAQQVQPVQLTSLTLPSLTTSHEGMQAVSDAVPGASAILPAQPVVPATTPLNTAIAQPKFAMATTQTNLSPAQPEFAPSSAQSSFAALAAGPQFAATPKQPSTAVSTLQSDSVAPASLPPAAQQVTSNTENNGSWNAEPGKLPVPVVDAVSEPSFAPVLDVPQASNFADASDADKEATGIPAQLADQTPATTESTNVPVQPAGSSTATSTDLAALLQESAPVTAASGTDASPAQPSQAETSVGNTVAKAVQPADAKNVLPAVMATHGAMNLPAPMPQQAANITPQPGTSSVATTLTSKSVTLKRNDAIAAPTAAVHTVPPQHLSDKANTQPGAASLTSNGNAQAQSGNDADQGDTNSSSDDHRAKSDVAVGADASMSVVQPTQVAPAVNHAPVTALPDHQPSAPGAQAMQSNPTATSSTALPGTLSAKAPMLETSASTDIKTVVGTSRLVQTLNQSEMRVGMRIADFGDITIRTSVAHDNIVAQISLDHPELASSLTAHIPEMQARLENHGNLEVHIDANGQNAGAGTPMSNGGSGSQGSREQQQSNRSYFQSSYSSSTFVDSALPVAAVASTFQSARSSGRLDLQA